MKKILTTVALIAMVMTLTAMSTSSLHAQNTKKQDWAQFYVFKKDNARILNHMKEDSKKESSMSATEKSKPENAETRKGKCPQCEWKARKIKAVLMGDSITELWWDLDSAFFKQNNFVGRGISGQTTSEMLVRFRRDVLDLRPQYVFIMAGTNDVAENNGKISLENILGNLKSMVELAKAHNIKPVLCSVPPAAGFVWRKDLKPAKDIIKLNRMIKEYAGSIGIPYIDYHSVLSDEKGALPAKYSKDGVHPILAGYKVMERLLLERFQKIDK